MTAKRSRRGAGRIIGFVLVLLGLIGGGALLLIAQRRPADTVERFARAPIGCTTTMSFSEIGTFYVYEETLGDVDGLIEECRPVADPSIAFDVEFAGELQPELIDADGGVTYDVDGFEGRSVERIVISELGEYDVSVSGGDVDVVAAIGGLPDEGVGRLRVLALATAAAGVLVGLLLVMISSRRAGRNAEATPTAPDGDGAEFDAIPPAPDGAAPWPPVAPQIRDSAVASWMPPPNPSGTPAPIPPTDVADRADWPAPSGEPHGPLPPPAPPADD